MITIYGMRLLAALLIAVMTTSAQAREDVQEYPIAAALAQGGPAAQPAGGIQFYFGSQPYPQPSADLGSFRTSKRTHATGKSISEACNGAFVAAMAALEERALREGGNAVVDIKSNYDDALTESNTSFKCGAGKIMAGVALEGRVVRLPEVPVPGNDS